MAPLRHPLCVVPSAEILALTAELRALGGEEVAVGPCWTRATAAVDDTSATTVVDDLHHELWPWLCRGFNAAVLLLKSAASATDAATCNTVVERIGAAALAHGMQLGIAWQLLHGNGSICGPLATQQQQQQAPSSRTGSRLGRDVSGQGAGNGAATSACTIRVESETGLQQVVAAAARQLEVAAAAAAAEGLPMASLLVQLALRAAEGQPPAVLHVIQPASTPSDQQHLIRLLQEVADLHQRCREGDHVLAGAKLAPLTQAVAPLLAGTTRLFLIASLCSGGGSSQEERKLLSLLSAAKHIRAVCAKGASASATPSPSAFVDGSSVAEEGCVPSPATAWLPCQLFLQQLDQQRQAERQRKAEAMALAAAEADRREKLRMAAKQREQQQQQPPPPMQQPASVEATAQQQEGTKQCSPVKQADMSAAGQQQQQQRGNSSQQPTFYQPAAYAPCEAHHEMEAAPACDEVEAAGLGSPDSSRGLERLRLQFQTLYQQATGDNGGSSGSQRDALEAVGTDLGDTLHYASRKVQANKCSSPSGHRQEQGVRRKADVAAAEDVATHVATQQMRAVVEALRAEHEQLEAELGIQQQQATPGQFGSFSHLRGGVEESAEQGSADVASLADVDAPALSLGAMYRSPASGLTSGSFNSHPCSSTVERQPRVGQQPEEQHLAAWGAAESPARWPVAAVSGAADVTPSPQLVSDFFTSENAHPSATPQPPPQAADPADAATAGPAGRYDWLPGATTASSSGSAMPPQPPSAIAMWPLEVGGVQDRSGGSYSALHKQPAAARGSPPTAADFGSPAGQRDTPPGQLSPAIMPTAPAAAAVAVDAAYVADLLDDLEREQRINATLLRQLHEMQLQLEESASAAASASVSVQPLAPGIEDPADFNALLSALQLERQNHMVTRQQLQLQQQQAEEEQLGLEALLHTQHRQLLMAAARCRAWEQHSPLPSLFQRYEEEVQHLQAQCQRLEAESQELARLLAEADLDCLSNAAQRSPEETAAFCREQHRKAIQAQTQISKLQQERAALLKQMQGAERRDRLAELCRKQAEAGMRTLAELRQQLATRQRQLETQSLAAAQAGAEASQLREQLDVSEGQLGRAITENEDLHQTVDSLRKQVALLRGQAGRDRVLRSMQLAGPL